MKNNLLKLTGGLTMAVIAFIAVAHASEDHNSSRSNLNTKVAGGLVYDYQLKIVIKEGRVLVDADWNELLDEIKDQAAKDFTAKRRR